MCWSVGCCLSWAPGCSGTDATLADKDCGDEVCRAEQEKKFRTATLACSTNTIEFIPGDPAVAPMWACDGPHFISVVNMLRETLAMVVPKEGEEIPHADEVERHARHGCQWYHKGDQCGYTYTYRGRTLTKTKTGLSSGAALSTLNHQLILEKQPQQGQYPGARFTEKPGVKQRGTRGGGVMCFIYLPPPIHPPALAPPPHLSTVSG